MRDKGDWEEKNAKVVTHFNGLVTHFGNTFRS